MTANVAAVNVNMKRAHTNSSLQIYFKLLSHVRLGVPSG
jgi:hypothetical protein